MTKRRLIEELAFDKPESVSDGQGGREDGWGEQYQARGHFMHLRGSETVIASRLAGVQPVVITIRAHADQPEIAQGWRVRDLRKGKFGEDGEWEGHEYNIRSAVPTDDRNFLEITADRGRAV